MKAKNLIYEADPDDETMKELHVKKLTNKQRIIAKLSNYLFDVTQEKLINIFYNRLRKLEHFLLLLPV